MFSSLHKVFYIHQVHTELTHHQILLTLQLSTACYTLPPLTTGLLAPGLPISISSRTIIYRQSVLHGGVLYLIVPDHEHKTINIY